MIDFSVFLICSGIFLSAFTISFAIVSQFVDNIIFVNAQPENPEKYQYYYNHNFIDYAEVVDASNNDYIEGMYEEETPVVAEQALEDNTTDTEGKVKTEELNILEDEDTKTESLIIEENNEEDLIEQFYLDNIADDDINTDES